MDWISFKDKWPEDGEAVIYKRNYIDLPLTGIFRPNKEKTDAEVKGKEYCGTTPSYPLKLLSKWKSLTK